MSEVATDNGKLQWSDPKIVNTKNGERTLQSAPPTERFWTAWKGNKQALVEKGIQVTKDKKGNWIVNWWKPVSQENEAGQIEASRSDNSALEIPAPAGLEYRGFQKAAIEYASHRTGTLLGLEQGLGKTICTIGFINLKEDDIKHILIICPATLKLNWRNELQKWLIREHDIVIVPDGKTWMNCFDSPVMATIINYDLLAKHHKNIHAKKWDLVVVDECQYLKSDKTARTKALLGGGQGKGKPRTSAISSKFFLALSGTPIPNKPIEIYNIAHHLAPHEFPNYYQFGKRYCGGQLGWGGKLDFTGASNLAELQRKFRRSMMYRVLKEDVLPELPSKHKQVIEMPPSSEMRRELDKEKRIYKLHKETSDSLRARLKMAEINEDTETFRKSARELKEGIKVAFAEMARVRAKIAELKAPYVIHHVTDLLDNVNKIVVFCWHRSLLNEILIGMEKLGIETVSIHGGTKMSDRQEAVDRFQKGSVRVFVGNMVAAGTGITLTASSNVVMAEMDWTPGNMAQAEDRTHRIGQPECVMIQYLIMENSLDSTMMNRVVDKQSNIDAALDTPIDIQAEILSSVDEDNPPELPEIPDKPLKKKTPYREIGESMTIDQKDTARLCLNRLVAMDSDKATVVNGAGFSKFDGNIGHELAGMERWSSGQAGYAKHLAVKYRRQLPENLIALLVNNA